MEIEVWFEKVTFGNATLPLYFEVKEMDQLMQETWAQAKGLCGLPQSYRELGADQFALERGNWDVVETDEKLAEVLRQGIGSFEFVRKRGDRQ